MNTHNKDPVEVLCSEHSVIERHAGLHVTISRVQYQKSTITHLENESALRLMYIFPLGGCL